MVGDHTGILRAVVFCHFSLCSPFPSFSLGWGAFLCSFPSGAMASSSEKLPEQHRLSREQFCSRMCAPTHHHTHDVVLMQPATCIQGSLAWDKTFLCSLLASWADRAWRFTPALLPCLHPDLISHQAIYLLSQTLWKRLLRVDAHMCRSWDEDHNVKQGMTVTSPS